MGFMAADMVAARRKPTATYSGARKITSKTTERGDKRVQTAAKKPVAVVKRPAATGSLTDKRSLVAAREPRPKPTVTDFDGIARRADIEKAATKATSQTATNYGPSGPTNTGSSASSTVPSPTTASVDAEEQAEIDKVQADADATLQSQLDAIAAEYGLTRAQLDAEQGEVGRQWQQTKLELVRQAFNAQEASINSMIERGIIKSGITVQEKLELERQEEAASDTADVDQRVSLADIAARRAAVAPQEAAAVAQATAAHEQQLRDLELMKAAYGQD